MNDETDAKQNLKTPVFILLEFSSETPLYQQIRDQIVVAIADGHLSDGSPLPTTRQMASDFGINFHTVNKAYDLLRREGFVSMTRKHGSFVRRETKTDFRRIEDWGERLRTLLAEGVARGLSADKMLVFCKTTLSTFPGPPILPGKTISPRRSRRITK